MPEHEDQPRMLIGRLKLLLGSMLILFQLVMIVHARLSDARYFSWAPHDVMWAFDLEVTVDGQRLNDSQLDARYRLRRHHYHEHAIEHVIRAIRQFEQSYAQGEQANVVLTYARNGGEEQRWLWPEQ